MAIDQITAVLALPTETLALLASGYVAYRLAYTGRDQKHRAIDVAFMVAAFAFFAKGLLELVQTVPLSDLPFSEYLARYPDIQAVAHSIISFFGTLVFAAIWRSKLSIAAVKTLHWLRVSRADDTDTALQSITRRSDAKLSSVCVVRTDGSVVQSAYLGQFEREVFGPVIFGEDGSVALYVTSIAANLSADVEEQRPEEGDWGIQLRYIPASEIKEIRINHQIKASAGVWAYLVSLVQRLVERWSKGRVERKKASE